MNQDVSANTEAICIPASAAEAWAAVYIDVAEKLDAEEHQATDSALQSITKGVATKREQPQGEPACPST